jgi:hypothetical protein
MGNVAEGAGQDRLVTDESTEGVSTSQIRFEQQYQESQNATQRFWYGGLGINSQGHLKIETARIR